jgi:hypothetical protein
MHFIGCICGEDFFLMINRIDFNYFTKSNLGYCR